MVRSAFFPVHNSSFPQIRSSPQGPRPFLGPLRSLYMVQTMGMSCGMNAAVGDFSGQPSKSGMSQYNQWSNGSISIIFEHVLSFRSGNSQFSSFIIIYHSEVGFHNYHHLSSFIIIYHHLSFRSGNSQLSSFIIIYHLEVGFHNYHHLSSFDIICHSEVGFHKYHHLSSFIIWKWDFTTIIWGVPWPLCPQCVLVVPDYNMLTVGPFAIGDCKSLWAEPITPS